MLLPVWNSPKPQLPLASRVTAASERKHRQKADNSRRAVSLTDPHAPSFKRPAASCSDHFQLNDRRRLSRRSHVRLDPANSASRSRCSAAATAESPMATFVKKATRQFALVKIPVIPYNE